jgi:anti-sigma B factor antagonist
MSKPRSVTISMRSVAGITIVDLEGDIDVNTSNILRASLFETLPRASRLALNMSGIRYIDSAGVAILVEAQMNAKKLEKDLALFALGARVKDVLKLTRLLGYFRIFETEEQAVTGAPTSNG